MLVICEDCAKKYNVDEARITGRRARFTCNQCGHIIIIDKADLSRPLLSRKNTGDPPPTVDLPNEEGRRGPAASSLSGDLQEASEDEDPDPPRQPVQRKNRGIPLFSSFIMTVLLAFVFAGAGGYLYAKYLDPGASPPGRTLVGSLLLVESGWLVTVVFFSLYGHLILQKFNLLIKCTNQLGAGNDSVAIGKKGPREVRNLAFALERIRQRFVRG